MLLYFYNVFFSLFCFIYFSTVALAKMKCLRFFKIFYSSYCLSSNESDFYGLDLVNNNPAQKQIIVESCAGGGRFSENNRIKSYGF